jgi:hypothetical protein
MKPGNAGAYDSYPYIDGDISLASAAIVDDRRRQATDPETSWENLLQLAYKHDRMTAAWLAENPSSTADILDIIIDVAEPGAKIAVARHARTVEETLTVLLTDANESVRAATAGNPILLRSDQVLAAKDTSHQVQLALLNNSQLDPFAAQQLRRSVFKIVREQMAARDAAINVGASK